MRRLAFVSQDHCRAENDACAADSDCLADAANAHLDELIACLVDHCRSNCGL